MCYTSLPVSVLTTTMNMNSWLLSLRKWSVSLLLPSMSRFVNSSISDLPSTIFLVLSCRHQMMSWVKRLNAKLREMKLMAPSENLYTSHLPENRSHLLPTRDPNSPLPLPPTMPYIPPGVEPVSSSSTENSGTYFRPNIWILKPQILIKSGLSFSENLNRIVPDSSSENPVPDNPTNSNSNANSGIIGPSLRESSNGNTNVDGHRSPIVNAGISDPVSSTSRLVI